MTQETEADADPSDESASSVHVLPPIGMLIAPSNCWKCGSKLDLVGLCALTAICADGETYGGPGELDGLVLLTYIEKMPDTLRRTMSERGRNLELMFSSTYDGEYFANRCTCGAIQGDHHLHKPGGPFWPETEDAAAAIAIEWLPIQDISRVGCGLSWTDSRIAEYVRAHRANL
jgi:hypothetical protein